MSLRDEFLLDPDVVFLNHGSFGACPRPVLEVYQRWQLELERQPVEFLRRRVEPLLASARGRLAEYVGAPVDDLAFVPNATAGLTIAARSLALGPGDEVLATELEYGACDLLWEHACSRAGARYVRAPVPLPLRGPEDAVDAVWSRVTRRTRVLFLSHVTSVTSFVLPVADLCRRAREAGIVSVVDGAHAPGQLPLDLAALGADVYAGNCHKWLCAPKGAGFVHIRPEFQERAEPLVLSWGLEDGSSFATRHERQGTRDPAAYLSVPAAIDWQAARDWPAVRARCRQLTRAARLRLAEATGIEPLAPDSPALLPPQMVSTALPHGAGEELQDRLARELGVEVLVKAQNGQVFLRASFQGYNDERDLETLVEALDRLLAR